MGELRISESITTWEARARTLGLAAKVAGAMATCDMRPNVKFERPLDTRFKRGLADPRPSDGWKLGDAHKYLAGYHPSIALENGEIWLREILILGTDSQLRTVYEAPRGDCDYGRSRVFHNAWLEGWQLREPHQRPMPIVAMREHDADATRGDYFLAYSRMNSRPSLLNRHEDDVNITNEQFVQDMLHKLARDHELPTQLIDVRAS